MDGAKLISSLVVAGAHLSSDGTSLSLDDPTFYRSVAGAV